MIDGIKLSLMIGPLVPLPVSRDVIDALTAVQVTSAAGSSSGFQLTFTLSNRSPLHTLFVLSSGTSIAPIVRVVIIVTVGGTPHVLMDGVMTDQQVTPGETPGQSTLTVTGEDLTKVMDFIPFTGVPYPAMPPEARVLVCCAKYAFLGIVPMIIPSVLIDVPIPIDRIPRHQGTDLAYIKSLADEVGYVFYVEPGPVPGANVAYWGPEIKVGVPQPALNVDMDAHTNVESLQFGYAADSKTLPVVWIQNQQTKVPFPIPIPDVNPLSPPLGIVPPIPKRISQITDTAKFSPVRGVIVGLAKAAQSADVVTASGNLDVLRYGHVLKSRRLVGVRGAGITFDGLWYVKSVTHSIKRGEYKQSFSLSRNALVPNVPKVPV
jgi:hypothetical protein